MSTSTTTDTNTTDADSPPGIFAHHLAKLRSSGLSDATITAAKVYSEANTVKLAAILGMKRCPFKSAALVLPYIGIDGQNGYARVRPDNPRKSQGKPVKYESPRGRRNEAYLPPGVAAVPALEHSYEWRPHVRTRMSGTSAKAGRGRSAKEEHDEDTASSPGCSGALACLAADNPGCGTCHGNQSRPAKLPTLSVYNDETFSRQGSDHGRGHVPERA